MDKSVFSLPKLTILNLDGCSNLKKLPTNYFMLSYLKELNLSYCKKLEKIPDFSATPNLERLCLKECTHLTMIHESLGSLDKLRSLVLTRCTNLIKLPNHLRLKSLHRLYLSGCSKLENFPTIDENMKSLECLDLDFTAIKELPSSIGHLTKLSQLRLDGCTNLISLPNTIYLLKRLKELHLSGCSRFEMVSHKSDPTIHIHPICSSSKMMETTSWSSEFSHLLVPNKNLCSKLTFLDLQSCNISNAEILEILCDEAPFLSDIRLSENRFSSLPSCFHKLMSLWNIELRNCKFLREIPNLPQNIQKMDATGCVSLARSPDNILDIISKKQDFTLGEISREFLLTGVEIPEWFNYKTKTNLVSASFRHYPDMERTLAACVTFKVNGDSSKRGALIACHIFICNRLHCSFTRPFLPSKSEYMWLVTTSLAWGFMEVNDWNKVLVWFEVHDEVNASIRSCGVHVTEELHGIQTDLKWPVVNYADFHQLEKLQNLDIDDVLAKRLFQGMCYISNCKAMLHATCYDPETIESKIQPMSYPLHVTYNGYTVIRGMEGMGDTALADSLCNKFNWKDDEYWRRLLDSSTRLFESQGREMYSFRRLCPRKHGDCERGTNITSHTNTTISSKIYFITFKNLDETEYADVKAWAGKQSCWSYGRLERQHNLLIKMVDSSFAWG